MKNILILFAMLLISIGVLAQSPIKVDFDKDERALDEVHEPGSVSFLPMGIYFLKIQQEGLSETIKFIKK